MNTKVNYPTSIFCVAPSRVALGEPFALKIKVLGPLRKINCSGNWKDSKPALNGPFNLNVARNIQYHDDCLPEWRGNLEVDAGKALHGDRNLEFDGRNQGAFPGDTRPICIFEGYTLHEPGFHFIRIIDPDSGAEGWSNPIYVSDSPLQFRIFWGDPHWQTFFSDGIRCPEELYAFARDEAFLDFGAVSDHMEGITERQWDYFQAVTNDFNEPGRFATLIGQEWTHHNPEAGAPGHRNIYVRSDSAPALRSDDPECNSLEKLWCQLDCLPEGSVIAIPHHSANVVMGVDWELGWNPEYEKAVEIHSIWGSSECHANDGNMLPILSNKGEMRGRHVRDALDKGYRLGVVGGGDIHDGRPGLPLVNDSYLKLARENKRLFSPCGYTAAKAASLTREAVFDAISNRQTYASTQSRIYLDVEFHSESPMHRFSLTAASEEGIREAKIIVNGEESQTLRPDYDPRVLICEDIEPDMDRNAYCYVRITTENDNIAWSSPIWNCSGKNENQLT